VWDVNEIESAQLQELRRGTAVLACLMLLRSPQYGYALLEQLADAGIPVEGNTLYPLLRRLEAQGLLLSEWNTEESRPRKFYRTSTAGDALATVLLEDWNTLQTSIDRIAQENR
jgi:PadR family transcriptional regulator, regulatory protein PadR